MVVVGMGCNHHLDIIDTLLMDMGNNSGASGSSAPINGHIEASVVLDQGGVALANVDKGHLNGI